jgi:uncharacterized membrane protein
VAGGLKPGLLPTKRIEALTDGVFAIAMTLLVLELRLPPIDSDAAFIEALGGLLPRLASYVLSFLVLGAYWLGLHVQYEMIDRIDRKLAWVAILFLLLISALPFTTSLIGEHPDRAAAVVTYGLHLALSGLLLYVHWWWASGPGRLVRAAVSPVQIRRRRRITLVGPTAFVLGIPVAIVFPQAAIVLYLAVLVFYIALGATDRFADA